MPDEIERQLEAFGETLEARTGEPIRPGTPAASATDHRPGRRWWAVGGAAACLVAVVAGLALVNRPRADAPAAPPAAATTTTTTVPVPDALVVGDDPLALERDGWTLVERTTDPFELSPDDLPCPTSLDELSGIAQVHDILTPPDIAGLDVDVQILDVGSLERGSQLTEVVQMIARCLEEQEGVDVETTSLSSIRATWFRAGPDFALASIVGEGNLSIMLEIEGAVFADSLVADLAHRADQFLGRVEVIGAPGDTPVATTTLVAQEGPFVERGPGVGEATIEPLPGELKLWVSNQSFTDDPVSIIVRLDGIAVVGEPFFVEGQHNWQSFLIRGLAPGEHTVTAESDTGVTTSWTFTLPRHEARWLVVDYWNDPDDPEGRRFTFHESDQPVVFS
ncbi:MAG TPA: hypothetical protein VK917_01080 [Ilumatobacter sp.]|nr:hypothetical protein [Ilumatobacter sp.]